MCKKLLLLVVAAGLLFNSFSNPNDDALKAEVQTDVENKIMFSGYFDLGVTAFDLSEVKKIVKEFDGLTFDLDNKAFTTFNLGGYINQKSSGIRAGINFMGGYNSTYSSEWTTIVDSIPSDSVIRLHMSFVQGAFLVDKMFPIRPKFNMYAGGMLGGGAVMAIAQYMDANSSFRSASDFDDDDDDDWGCNYDYEDDDNAKIAVAPYWSFDIHGGATYSFTNWIHVGVNLYAQMMYSPSGFGNRGGSFYQVNPGASLKVIFGKSV